MSPVLLWFVPTAARSITPVSVRAASCGTGPAEGFVPATCPACTHPTADAASDIGEPGRFGRRRNERWEPRNCPANRPAITTAATRCRVSFGSRRGVYFHDRVDAAPLPVASLPTSIPSLSGDALSGPCPVTEPVSREEIPRLVVDGVLGAYQGPPVENIGNWYGNDALWVELPPRSTVVKLPGEDLSEKFPWVRLIRGYIRIVGQRLDGPAPPANGEASTGNGPIGFNSSGIAFPTTGCWRITGTITAHDLTFVVNVERSP